MEKLLQLNAKAVWRTFIINITLVIIIFFLGIFLGLFIRNEQLINEEILVKARTNFYNILLTKRWNASYGGVYVKKGPGVESNPYLKNPDLTTIDGQVLTLKNPALMTREISELAEKEDLFQFHITSLRPMNPLNAPDTFETDALKKFELGAKEVYAKVHEGDQVIFRYMAPLITEKSCLQCHREYGYKLGDVRGGISVNFNITHIERKLKNQKIIIIVLGALTLLHLLGILYFFVLKLMRTIIGAQEQIQEMVITDDLTKLHNRRYLLDALEREVGRGKRYNRPMSLLMVDFDLFKNINDVYGHRVGDQVLAEVAQVMKGKLRATDMLTRYGGEEFVAVLPETNADQASTVAESLRSLVEEYEIVTSENDIIQITVSIGVVTLSPELLFQINDVYDFIARADDALLAAKRNGRNRIGIFGEHS